MHKTCFLIGNHDAGAEIYPALYDEIERHVIEYNVAEFFVGYYGKFDMMAIHAVNEIQASFPGIRLTLVMHYLNSDKYTGIMHHFTGSIFPDGLEKVPLRYAIAKGNRLMVDKADYLIAYNRNTTGNVDKLLNYAMRCEKRSLIKISTIKHEKQLPGN